ncbi:MAG: hypothetical protein R2791_16805 [Saprospiraceae bacterium]
MNDFKLEFTLKQHTPLIHFQHDQAGATLRATEVKARLDAFVTETWKLVSPKTWEKHKLTIQKGFLPFKAGLPVGIRISSAAGPTM